MQNQKITIEVIETKEFHVAARGYNQREVDEFLDSICDELERIEGEMAALQQENDRLRNQAVPAATAAYQPPKAAPAAPVSGADSTFKEILEMAQRVKAETIADAQAKAAEIIKNAELEVRARLGNLVDEKEAVEAEIASLKAAAKEYKSKFNEMLSAAHDALAPAEEML